jgi:hypothetical protein
MRWSGDRGRTQSLRLLLRIDPTGFMKVKMNIALRKRTLSPVRLVLKDSPKRSFMLFVVVSLQLGSTINSNNLIFTVVLAPLLKQAPRGRI